MIVNREDMKVLLHGITRYCEDHWMLADLSDDEIRAEHEMVDDFDSAEISASVLAWLDDIAECCEDIAWSIDIVRDYLRMSIPQEKLTSIPNERAPEAFYTGGGIWISAVYVDSSHYYVVDSDYRDCLTMYDHMGEDQDTLYSCQNMVDSKNVDELTPDERKYYDALIAALDEKMNR